MKVVSAQSVVTGAGRAGSAILIDGARVAAIGERDDLLASGRSEEQFPGATIVPGFRDAHIHAAPYASLLAGCSLKNATSIDDMIERIAAFADTIDPESPVVATRLDDEHLQEGRLPGRADLDRAVPDRPLVIYRYCGHIAVANSFALDQSGISAATDDPDGGSIDRDQAGRPTGVLRETAASLISPALARGQGLQPAQLIAGLHRLAGLGITSIGAMMGYGEQPSEQLEAELELWRSVASELPINVFGIAITDDPRMLEHAADVLTTSGPRLRWHGVKRFADGSLGGHTAAMHSAFADDSGVGTYRLTAADAAIAQHSIDLGGSVCIHAIGDRAVDGVLDVFETLIAAGADPDRLRMEHASILSPEQIVRFAQSGTTACVQPAFLASESDWLFKRVGESRRGWVYPFRSMTDAGIPLAGSSDSPVEPPHPLWGMAAAIDRYGILPDEALAPLDSLALFTQGAARSLHEPTPLHIGSPADFVVLDTDPSVADAQAIHDAQVLATYVDGEPITLDRNAPAWVD
ncbi:MAG: amidohydrolase [Acidimicrobiia bacterium]